MCSYEKFVDLHRPQLCGIDLPESLWQRLYNKLVPAEILDAKETFSTGTERTLLLKEGKRLDANDDVFLVRHVFFSDGAAEARKKLETSPSALERLEKLTGIWAEEKRDGVHEEDMRQLVSAQTGVDERTANELLLDSNFEVINAILRHEGGRSGEAPVEASTRVPAELDEISLEEFKLSLSQSLGEDNMPDDEDHVQKLYQDFLSKRGKTYEEDRKCVEHLTGRYSWHQEGEDGTVTVSVRVPKTAKKKDISSKLTHNHWTFGIKGTEPVVDGDLFMPCVPDESYWTFGEPGVVVMTMQKKDVSVGWEEMIKGEVQLDEKQLEERARELHQAAQLRVPKVLHRIWQYGQTYQAVTREGDDLER